MNPCNDADQILLQGQSGHSGEYRLVVMSEPSPNPHKGIPLEDKYGTVFRLNGAEAPLWGGAIQAGDTLELEIRERDLLRARRGREGSFHVVLLVLTDASVQLDGGRTLDGSWTLGGQAWTIGASWSVSLRPGPEMDAFTLRLPDDSLLLVVRTPEPLGRVFALYSDRDEQVQEEITWAGLADAVGWRVFYRVLPTTTQDLEVWACGNNSNRLVRVRIPEHARIFPAAPPRWNLPPWLPPTGWTGHILEAIERGLPDPRGAELQLSPQTARGEALDMHANFQGLERHVGERDDLLRMRVMAVLRGRYLGREPLSVHLSEYSSSPVRVYDAMSAQNLLRRLDGGWTLDGSVQLGGDACGLIWRFRVAVRNPRVPLDWLREEVERLRPLGSVPELVQENARTTSLLPVGPVRQVMSLSNGRRATVSLKDGWPG